MSKKVWLEATITVRYEVDPRYYQTEDNPEPSPWEMALVDTDSFERSELTLCDFQSFVEEDSVSITIQPV